MSSLDIVYEEILTTKDLFNQRFREFLTCMAWVGSAVYGENGNVGSGSCFTDKAF